jgi:hypothetical protein
MVSRTRPHEGQSWMSVQSMPGSRRDAKMAARITGRCGIHPAPALSIYGDEPGILV